MAKRKNNRRVPAGTNSTRPVISGKPVAWKCKFCKALFYKPDEIRAHRDKCKTYKVTETPPEKKKKNKPGQVTMDSTGALW